MKRRTGERLLEPDEVVSADELFERLEQQTTRLNGTSFAADFNAMRKVAEAAGDADSVTRLDMERAAQLVWLSEHGIAHFHAWEAPDEAQQFLQVRKVETNNELLQLRYGLVWLTTLPRGRHTHALAVEMVARIQEWLKKDQGRHKATQETYFDLVQLGLLLSREYRCEPEKMRERVLEYLIDGEQPVVLRWWHIQFFGKRTSLLLRQDCERLDAVGQQVLDHYKADDRYMVQLVCEAMIPLAARALTDTQKWHRQKGDSIKTHALKRYADDPTDFIVQSLLNDALDCYHAAGDKQQVQAVESLLSTTKHDAKLNKVEFNFTLDGPEGKFISAWMRKLPAWVLEDDEQVFWRMRFNLMPSRPTPIVDAQTRLADVFRHVAFDRNRNITTRQQGPEHKQPFSPYSLLMGFYRQMTFETFAQGLQSGQITYATTMEFLREQTWLGQMEYHRGQDDPDEPGYTLIPWVEPALRSYFAEMEKAQNDPDYKPDLMLCIDSLTVKLEGILRHFCRALPTPIATNRRARNGDQQEKTLEEIIQSVESYSGADAGYWLRFVLFCNNF